MNISGKFPVGNFGPFPGEVKELEDNQITTKWIDVITDDRQEPFYTVLRTFLIPDNWGLAPVETIQDCLGDIQVGETVYKNCHPVRCDWDDLSPNEQELDLEITWNYQIRSNHEAYQQKP